ncbi:MAG: toll/interleukin-1 receptor domain-containing protein [Aggregatilineales bacterium]
MKLFISYSRADMAIAMRLADDLAQQGYSLWLDVRSIPHGANWDNEVQRGLDESDVMLVLLSPSSSSSQNVADEWSYFIEKRKKILPLMIQPCEVPFRLSRRQRVDFTRSYDQGLSELVRALNEPSAEDGSLVPPALPPLATTAAFHVSWADGYNWWTGLRPHLATGEATVLPNEWRLIAPRRLPLVIPVGSLTAARTIHTPWDTYLLAMFRDAADHTHTLAVTGTDRKVRAATMTALQRALSQAAGHALG